MLCPVPRGGLCRFSVAILLALGAISAAKAAPSSLSRRWRENAWTRRSVRCLSRFGESFTLGILDVGQLQCFGMRACTPLRVATSVAVNVSFGMLVTNGLIIQL